jgi:hypothetical protein
LGAGQVVIDLEDSCVEDCQKPGFQR